MANHIWIYISTNVVSEETNIKTKVQKIKVPISYLTNDPTCSLVVEYTTNGAAKFPSEAQAMKVPIKEPMIYAII